MIPAAFKELRDRLQRGRPGYVISLVLICSLAAVLFATHSFALIDLPIFGPKRYDRLKGKPTVYTDTFDRCMPSYKALLQVQNGDTDNKRTRMKSARIYINNVEVASEKDFKQKVPNFEKPVAVKDHNELKVVLKSGHHGYLDKLAKYERKKVDQEQKLKRLEDLRTEVEGLQSLTDPAEVERLLKEYRTIRKDHESYGIDLDAIDGDLDGEGDDDPSIDPDWASKDKEWFRQAREEIKEAIQGAEKALKDLGKNKIKQLKKTEHALKELVKELKHIDHATEKAIKKIEKIEKKIAKIKAKGPSFLIINIIGKDCDDTPPVIFDPRPPDGSLLKDGAPEISAQYADEPDGSGINPATARMTVDGTDVTSMASVTTSGISYTPSANLPEGDHTVEVYVEDRATNPASLSWQFKTDTIPPAIEITSHTEGQYINTPVITLSGDVSEPVTKVTVNGADAAISGTTFSLSGLSIAEGENTVTVVATDLAGNIGSKTITLNLDTVPPVVRITSHQDGRHLNTPVITVSGAVNEPIIEATVNGTSAPITADRTGYSLPGVSLTEGENVIIAEVKDRAGNPGSVTITIILDTIAPVIVVANPVHNSYVNTPEITVSGTVTELHLDGFWINGETVGVTGQVFSRPNFALAQGSNTVTALARDKAGNESTVLVNVTLDTTNPVVSDPVPADGAFLKTATPEISVQYADDAMGTGIVIETARITVDGVDVTGNAVVTVSGVTYRPAANLPEGDHTVSVIVEDRATNPGSLTWTFTTDTIAPIADITSHENEVYLNTSPVTLSGTLVDDPLSPPSPGQTGIAVTVNSQAAQVTPGGFSIEGFALTEGANTIAVEAKDPAGNIGTDSIVINLDTAAPVIAVTSHVNGQFLNTPQITLTGTVDEPVTAFTINGNSVVVTDGAFSHIVTLQEGENTFQLSATDRATNIGTHTITIHLDTIPPFPQITSHQANQYLNTPVIEVTGSVNEPIIAATVNNAAAQITEIATDFNLAGVQLTEGPNTITVEVTDRAGNIGTVTITINLDTTAPVLQLTSHQDGQYLNTPQITIAGSADEPLTSVTVNNGAAQIDQATTGYSLTGITLAEGENPFTITATDRAGNTVTLNVTLTLDTLPPAIEVTTPVHNSYVNTAQIVVSGTVTELHPSTFRVNDTEVPLTDGAFSLDAFSLTNGINVIRLQAEDLAGNSSTVSVFVTLDITPPTVSISTPVAGSLTNTTPITVIGSANEPIIAATIGGTEAQVTGSSFSLGAFTLSEGTNTIIAEVTDRAGNTGTGSIEATLDTQAPAVSLQAPATAAAGANVIIATNVSDNKGLSLLEIFANGTPLWSSTLNAALSSSNSISLTLSPDLALSSTVALQARAIDSAGNVGTQTAQISIDQGPIGPGYFQGEVYDDSRGLRLAGAEVILAANESELSRMTTLEDGAYFYEAGAGEYLVTLTKEGYTSVERFVSVRPEKNTVAIDARLTPVSTTQNLIDSTGATITTGAGGQGQGASLELSIPADALAEQVDVRLTPVSNQGLAGLLPLGWSPVAVLDIGTAGSGGQDQGSTLNFSIAATLKVPISNVLTLEPSSSVTLVSYDMTARQWIVKDPGTVSADRSFIAAALSSTGQFALVLPDPGTMTLDPVVGQQLPPDPGPLTLDPSAVTAAGHVVPPVAPPSVGLKAVGELVLSPGPSIPAPAPLVSGLILQGQVTEHYELFSGEIELPSEYIQDIVLYRYPCVTNLDTLAANERESSRIENGTVETTFPVTPSREYTITELMMGRVGIDITQRSSVETAGVMVGTGGARLIDEGGNIVVIPENALAQTIPVETRTVEPSSVSGIVGSDFTLLRAVSLDLMNQTLGTSAELSIPAPTSLNAGLPIVVAKAIQVQGVEKLKLVALARLSGSLITSDPGALTLAPGIKTSGTYFFLQAKAPLGFVKGTVKDSSGNLYTSALTTTNTCSLVDLTGADGTYLIASTVSAFTAAAVDIYKNDKGDAAGTITAAKQMVTVDLAILVTLPRVNSVSVDDGVKYPDGFEPTDPIVITFSEPVDKTSVTTATIILKDSVGEALPGVFSIDPEGIVVTFYPEAQLASETQHTVLITKSVRDLQGYLMGADATTTFTTKDTTPPPMPPAGSITATFPNAEGYVTITGTQGSAVGNQPVLLINDNSGEIVTISAESNGSFSGTITAMLGDEVRVMLMDDAGNTTLISYITFKSDDGRYLVTKKGGIVVDEASGAKLEIPEDALPGATIVKITPVVEGNLPHPVPQEGKFLAAINIDTGGIDFKKPPKLSVPAPSGVTTEDRPFVAQPRVHKNADGTEENVYVIRDSAMVIDGRLTTASPPFEGIPGFGIFAFAMAEDPLNGPVIISGYTYRDMDGFGGYNPVIDANGLYDQSHDLPVKGAVVRCPGALHFIAYSGQDGHYATYGFTAQDVCRHFDLTAIHPQTMFRNTASITTCDAPYIVNNFNFRLADADTDIPDTKAPSVTVNLQVASVQDADHQDARFVAGTIPVGTNLVVPVSIIDQDVNIVTLTVSYKTPDMPSAQNNSVQLTQSGATIHTPVSADNPTAIMQFTYAPQFSAPIAGSQSGFFMPNAPGTYVLTVEARDSANNESRRSIQVRAVDADEAPADSVDGPPVVDEMVPAHNSQEIMVTMPVMITFNEPVQNVNEETFQLFVYDYDPNTQQTYVNPVPAVVYTSLEGGRMKATLQPRNNMTYGKTYKVVVTTGITDIEPNPSAGDALLPLDQQYEAEFQTKVPQTYDLAAEDQFQATGGSNIALYTAASGSTYTYVTAGPGGYNIIDVTDPTKPVKVGGKSMTNAGVNWRYRGVAVDQQQSLLAMTEDIQYISGNQYGYIRFYDIGTDPTNPEIVGREKLAEAFTGIPGRVALYGDYAYVAMVGVGLQVVDIGAAKERLPSGEPSDGSTIVGIFDTVGQGYRHPTDILTYPGSRALLTTTSHHLLVLDISIPQFPQLVASLGPDASAPNNIPAWRVAMAPEFAYIDTTQGQGAGGMGQVTAVMDLAVVGSTDGRLYR